jgi:hypothetical protein
VVCDRRVEQMAVEAFYRAYRHDGRSRPAYDPAMMVGLLLYAYARGMALPFAQSDTQLTTPAARVLTRAHTS